MTKIRPFFQILLKNLGIPPSKKDALNLKIRNLFHDTKNKIGVMSGFAQCIYMTPKDLDIAKMPPEQITTLYSSAVETSRRIHSNSVMAVALLNELHDVVYKELKIDKSKPRLMHSKSAVKKEGSGAFLKKVIAYFFKFK